MTEFELQLRKKVYEKYPKTKKEFTCWQEKLRLEQLRGAYRLRLINEYRNSEIEQGAHTGIVHKQDELL